MEAHACERLDEVREEAEAYDCVGIDEGQFFPEIGMCFGVGAVLSGRQS